MSMTEILELKKKLYQLAVDTIQQKIQRNRAALLELKESAGSETKSSAGDKHETGRAMVHLEQEKMLVQLEENLTIKRILDKIDLATSHSTVAFGSLVITDKVRFFVSAALGKVHVDGYDYYLISVTSPLAKEFIGKKKADAVVFNLQEYCILEIG